MKSIRQKRQIRSKGLVNPQIAPSKGDCQLWYRRSRARHWSRIRRSNDPLGDFDSCWRRQRTWQSRSSNGCVETGFENRPCSEVHAVDPETACAYGSFRARPVRTALRCAPPYTLSTTLTGGRCSSKRN